MKISHSHTEATDALYMKVALAEAKEAAAKGEVPVGAVVVGEGRVIGTGHNRREERQNPLCHAEVLAIGAASTYLQCWRLNRKRALLNRYISFVTTSDSTIVCRLLAGPCPQNAPLCCRNSSTGCEIRSAKFKKRRGGRARLKALDSKSSLPVRVTGVRIPPSPPTISVPDDHVFVGKSFFIAY